MSESGNAPSTQTPLRIWQAINIIAFVIGLLFLGDQKSLFSFWFGNTFILWLFPIVLFTGGDIGLDLRWVFAEAGMVLGICYWCYIFWSELNYACFKGGPTRSSVPYRWMIGILGLMLVSLLLILLDQEFSIWPWVPAYCFFFLSCCSTILLYAITQRMNRLNSAN